MTPETLAFFLFLEYCDHEDKRGSWCQICLLKKIKEYDDSKNIVRCSDCQVYIHLLMAPLNSRTWQCTDCSSNRFDAWVAEDRAKEPWNVFKTWIKNRFKVK
jgi:hypothetical protein